MSKTILTEEQAHDGLLQEYSDAYKAAAGFRPTMSDMHMLGNMELYALVQDLYAGAEREAQWEAEQAKARKSAKAAERRLQGEIRANGCGPTFQSPFAAALREAI
jgi:hypothetical protein